MTRKALWWFLVLSVCSLFSPPSWAEQAAELEDQHFAQIISKTKRSVVAIGTYYFKDIPKNQYLGTGFVISNGRRIVTNYHVLLPVIENKKLKFLRVFHEHLDKKGVPVRIAATDPFHDLVILEHSSKPLPALELGDSSQVKEGFKVGFTGYPIGLVLGLNPTTHMGIVSSISPLIKPSPTARIMDGKIIDHLNDPYDVFSIDATAYPGNSGSPVYRVASGHVIGVINQVFIKGKKEHAITDPSGITYAIPSRFIVELEMTLSASDR
jgi:serine protease Do